MAKYSVLNEIAEPLTEIARWDSYYSGGTEHHYGDCRYAAESWDDIERHIVYKAEVVRHAGKVPRDNLRCVVTNLRNTLRNLYEKVYRDPSEIENRIKELPSDAPLYGLSIDRTRCTKFLANQFRVLMTAAAYVLLQELRLKDRHTSLRRAQVGSLRERRLKVAVWVETSTRRIVLHYPDTAPWRSDWCRIARTLGAMPLWICRYRSNLICINHR